MVVHQLTLAATGAARQFVARSELEDIRIPWPQPAMAQRWHDRLIGIIEDAADAEKKAAGIRAEVADLVDECLGRKQ